MRNTPFIAVITGSGIHIGDPLEPPKSFASIPGMPVPKVGGHDGTVGLCTIGNEQALVMRGRVHQYEGWSSSDVCQPIEYLHQHGVTHVVFTNAVGALTQRAHVGAIACITDIISLPSEHGVFPSNAIDHPWRLATMQRCLDKGLGLMEGTYVQVLGPQYETRAEVRMHRHLGADFIGMSTGTEIRYAANRGMKCIILSVVTNVLSDVLVSKLDHSDVVSSAYLASKRLYTVVEAAIFAA